MRSRVTTRDKNCLNITMAYRITDCNFENSHCVIYCLRSVICEFSPLLVIPVPCRSTAEMIHSNLPVDNLDQMSVGLYLAISSLNTSKSPNLEVA